MLLVLVEYVSGQHFHTYIFENETPSSSINTNQVSIIILSFKLELEKRRRMGFYSLDLLAWAAPAAGVPPTFQD
jgi:hypothetical protein